MLWKFTRILGQLIQEIKRDNVGAFAAQTAFFVVLSAIPYGIFLFSFIRFIPIDETEVLRVLENGLPDDVKTFILPVIEELYNHSVEILSVATITVLWSSAKAVQHLSNGLNVIYDLEETRNFVWLRIRSIGYMLAFSVGIIFFVMILLLGSELEVYLEDVFPLLYFIVNIILSIRYIILFIFLFLLFLVILRYLPNRKVRIGSQTLPALVSASAWVVLSYGLDLYVNIFRGFSVYGSMTTVILFLLWLYFGIYILFIVAELEAKFGGR